MMFKKLDIMIFNVKVRQAKNFKYKKKQVTKLFENVFYHIN